MCSGPAQCFYFTWILPSSKSSGTSQLLTLIEITDFSGQRQKPLSKLIVSFFSACGGTWLLRRWLPGTSNRLNHYSRRLTSDLRPCLCAFHDNLDFLVAAVTIDGQKHKDGRGKNYFKFTSYPVRQSELRKYR